jgi:glutathione S-transferase
VLLVGNRPISDSTAILSFIVDERPGSISATAEEWMMEDWADTALNAFVVASRWADARNWPRVRDTFFGQGPWFVRSVIAPMIRKKQIGNAVSRDVWRGGPDACWASFERTLDLLDTRTRRHEFFSGPRLSVADLGIFGQLHALRNDLTPWQRDAIAARPGLTRYLDRVDEATRSRANQA